MVQSISLHGELSQGTEKVRQVPLASTSNLCGEEIYLRSPQSAQSPCDHETNFRCKVEPDSNAEWDSKVSQSTVEDAENGPDRIDIKAWRIVGCNLAALFRRELGRNYIMDL